MRLQIHWKPFSFRLKRSLQTSQGIFACRQGWLLRLENSLGCCGWGEVSPLSALDLKACKHLLHDLGHSTSRQHLEEGMSHWPSPMAFGLGAALAELDELVGDGVGKGWLQAPDSALLLPAGEVLLDELDSLIASSNHQRGPLTLKWKVALGPLENELTLLHKILERIPDNARLRLDANGGWDRSQAKTWVNYLHHQPSLEWVEQPLPPGDFEGHLALLKQVPIALDESLTVEPALRKSWPGWQVRRPILEGDPRLLLSELEEGIGRRMISTAFETGIGRRWVNHLAALQQNGPTPTAPGLAPGWCPDGPLFSTDPELVWDAV